MTQNNIKPLVHSGVKVAGDLTVRHLFISKDHNYFGHHGEEPGRCPMIEKQSIRVVKGKGIEGDRFYGYRPGYKGQITFFEWEVYLDLCQRFGVTDKDVSAFRRNVVVSGVQLNQLIGKAFSIQGIRFQGIESCRPCYWMDQAFGPGAENAMKHHGGLRAAILDTDILRRSPNTNSPHSIDQETETILTPGHYHC